MKGWKTRYGLPLLMLALSAWTAGCEDTPLTGTSDGSIKMIANPTTVVIDTSQGQTEGTSAVTAQVFDADQRPLVGAEVIFVTTSGTLASGGAPNTVATNNNGIASDVLTLSTDDDATADVVATSGPLDATLTITKVISDGNQRPTAAIVADPPGGAEPGVIVVFDGSGSTDPDSAITCYQWQVSSLGGIEFEQGANALTYDDSYPAEQQVTAILRVSDDPAARNWCTSRDIAPSTMFNGFEALLRYPISDCRQVIADAGSNINNLQGPQQTVTLNGSGSSDPNGGATTYRWECGNGQASPGFSTSATFACTYMNNGATTLSWTATLTVESSCGTRDADSLQVTMTPEPTQP